LTFQKIAIITYIAYDRQSELIQSRCWAVAIKLRDFAFYLICSNYRIPSWNCYLRHAVIQRWLLHIKMLRYALFNEVHVDVARFQNFSS